MIRDNVSSETSNVDWARILLDPSTDDMIINVSVHVDIELNTRIAADVVPVYWFPLGSRLLCPWKTSMGRFMFCRIQDILCFGKKSLVSLLDYIKIENNNNAIYAAAIQIPPTNR